MEYTQTQKAVNRTRVMKRSNRIAGATQYGVDHLSLKKIGQKIGGVVGDVAKSVANVAITPVKAVADLVSKDDRIKDWGFQKEAFANESLGKLSETTMGIGTAINKVAVPVLAAATGASLITNAVQKNQDNKALDADVASATAKIPNVESSGSISQINPGVTVDNSGNTNQPDLVNTKPIVTTNVNKTPTNSATAQKIVSIAGKIPTGVKQDIKKIFTGTGSNDPSMLPKTKGLKDAEQVVNGGGALLSSTPTTLFGGNPLVLAGIGAAVLLVLIIALKSK